MILLPEVEEVWASVIRFMKPPYQSKIGGNPLWGASREMPVFTDGWMLQSQKAG